MNATKFHETALHHAGRVGREDLIELLVEFGGDIHVRDNLGRKPIDYTTPGSTSHICLQHYESKYTFQSCDKSNILGNLHLVNCLCSKGMILMNMSCFLILTKKKQKQRNPTHQVSHIIEIQGQLLGWQINVFAKYTNGYKFKSLKDFIVFTANLVHMKRLKFKNCR